MTALLLKYAPYLAIAVALIAAGGWLDHSVIDGPRYNHLKGEYSAYQLQDAHEHEAAQKAATDALEAQIAARNATEEHNAQVISQLQSQADHASADADFARRLLAAAQARSASSGNSAAKAEGGHAADAAAQGGSDQSVAQLLGPAAGECRDAINQLIALQAEIRPQL